MALTDAQRRKFEAVGTTKLGCRFGVAEPWSARLFDLRGDRP